jgi:dCMP deaminase
VHAEQNAILAAARFGISIQGGTMYTTVQPCFGCLKEMLQAGIHEVLYIHSWRSSKDADPEQQAQYDVLASRLTGGIKQLAVSDPRADWSRGSTPTAAVPQPIDEHGMQSQ